MAFEMLEGPVSVSLKESLSHTNRHTVLFSELL